MPILKLKDADIYYEVHGSGPPFLFLSETACENRGSLENLPGARVFARSHRSHFRLSWNGTIQQTVYQIYDGDVRGRRRSNTRSSEARSNGRLRPLHGRKGRAGSCTETPIKSKKLILASSGAGYPDQRGIPLKLCMEMVQMGCENVLANIPLP